MRRGCKSHRADHSRATKECPNHAITSSSPTYGRFAQISPNFQQIERELIKKARRHPSPGLSASLPSGFYGLMRLPPTVPFLIRSLSLIIPL
jgi:hypothetical protein